MEPMEYLVVRLDGDYALLRRTDIDSAENLIANHHSVPEIARIIGADSLGYLSVENAERLAGPPYDRFCTACFGGGYPTSVPKDGQKDRFEQKLGRQR